MSEVSAFRRVELWQSLPCYSQEQSLTSLLCSEFYWQTSSQFYLNLIENISVIVNICDITLHVKSDKCSVIVKITRNLVNKICQEISCYNTDGLALENHATIFFFFF